MFAVKSVYKDQLDWWNEYHLLYHILSPTFSLSFCVRVLEAAGLPEVYVCDSKQEWHFSDNTQNRHTHARPHTILLCVTDAHTLSFFLLPPLPFALQFANMSAVGSTADKDPSIACNRFLQAMPRLLKILCFYGGSDRHQLQHRHGRLFDHRWVNCCQLIRGQQSLLLQLEQWIAFGVFLRTSISSLLQCNRHLLTNFQYDLPFPDSMNLLWAWQCGFLSCRLEYKYGCYA